MALFKKKVNLTMPENLEAALELAPDGARYMKASLIYSVEKGLTGLLFEGWRDSNLKELTAGDRRPPFHMTIPTVVADRYFEKVNGLTYIDLERHGYSTAA